MALYSEKVMDHFKNPRNVGTMENADGIGEVGNAKCGDIMKIYLKIDNDFDTRAIRTARYRGSCRTSKRRIYSDERCCGKARDLTEIYRENHAYLNQRKAG